MKFALLFFAIILLCLNVHGQQPAIKKSNNNTTDSIITQKYFDIWKHLFLKRNKMEDTWFNSHIVVFKKTISHSLQGNCFTVSYKVEIDWMLQWMIDKFIVKIDPDYLLAPALPKATYLSEPQIEQALNSYTDGCVINEVAPIEHLEFPSQKDVIDAANNKANNDYNTVHSRTASNFEIKYFLPKADTGASGHPLMYCHYILDWKDEKCLLEIVDLATGNISGILQPCNDEGWNAVCDSPKCLKYYKIWKHLFMQKNGMNEAWFDKHIRVTDTRILYGYDETFRVRYEVNIDWLTCKEHDRFLVNVRSKNYPELYITRGSYFSEPEIVKALSVYLNSGSIMSIAPDEHLKYATQEEAYLAGHVPGGDIRYRQHCSIAYGSAGGNPMPYNHPYLFSAYSLPNVPDPCRQQTTDLITGDIVAHHSNCFHDDP